MFGVDDYFIKSFVEENELSFFSKLFFSPYNKVL